MAISKVKLPNNSVQDIHDSRISGVDTSPTSGSENVVTSGGIYNSLRVDKIKPIDSHTYENILATTSNYNTLFPLFRVIPTDWDRPVIVDYRMFVYVSGHESQFSSKHECEFVFFHDTIPAYSVKNFIGNTSYKNIYYNSSMRCTASYTSIGHLVGFNFYSNGNSYSRSCTTSGYERTFVVEITRLENCTIVWQEVCDTVSSTIVPGYVAGTTHTAIGNYNGITQGETHTGDANTNTIGYYLRTPSASRVMDAALYRYRLLFSSPDDTKWIPADTSTSTNATSLRDVNQSPINPFGQIVYYNTTTTVAAGSAPGSSYIWRQYEVTLGYSFNRTGAALVLSYPAPVYVKCAPQANGSAIIDSTTPYVQSLPSSADGKLYIYLGYAYSATNIALEIDHPVYFHDGTNIKIWTGKIIPSAPGTLDTTATTAQTTSSSEALSGNVTLHKIAKTGTYSDLIGKPTVDSSPTSGSSNLVTSGGVYTALADKIGSYVIPIYQDEETENWYVDSSVTYATISAAVNAGKLLYISPGDDNSAESVFIPATYSVDTNTNVIEVLGVTGALGVILFTVVSVGQNDSPSAMYGSLPIPTHLADLDDDYEHRVVTDAEKTTWNAKYQKPSGGIPASDIASGVIPTISTNISTDATSDVKTASPKAVKNYVDTELTGKSNAPFFATDQTTVAQLEAAIQANRPIWFVLGNTATSYAYIPYYGYNQLDGYIFFASTYDTDGVVAVTCSPGGVWNVVAYDMELADNKVTSLSASSTDVQYPSAKCVYDALLTKQAKLVSGTNIKTVKGESLLGSGNIAVSDGKSAYEVWLDAGNTGTVADYLASLQGPSGYSGAAGELQVVNDLVTGGTTAALSAQMGKQLKQDLDGKFVFLTESAFEALTSLDSTKIYCTYEDES